MRAFTTTSLDSLRGTITSVGNGTYKPSMRCRKSGLEEVERLCYTGVLASVVLFAGRTLGHGVLLYDGSFTHQDQSEIANRQSLINYPPSSASSSRVRTAHL